MTVAIVGATGFLGHNLINYLLEHTDYQIRALSRTADRLREVYQNEPRVTCLSADVFDEDQMTAALEGVIVAYYFVHMMGQKDKDFYAREEVSAHRFSAAVRAAGVKRVIYMGGLGNDHERLSEHLASRHNTGTILREHTPLVIEFRASMIIGKGSISYDIIRNLVHKLPVMTLPRWSISLTQPIALADALSYLAAAATVTVKHSQIVEIGGTEALSYRDLYKRYANWTGRHPLLVRLPFLPEWLGGWWLDLFTPRTHAKVGRVMVHSLSNAMIVTHPEAHELFPDIHPRPLEQAFKEAA